jgi:formate hydrogenlyase subunit 6/NADH:ubiquinone oxidoreductase subunit I
LSNVFSGRFTLKFPKEEYGFMAGYRGVPVPNEKTCVGCGSCSMVCPAEAISLDDRPKENKRLITWLYDRCILCGLCSSECPQPVAGVKMSENYCLADYTAKKMNKTLELELILCIKCGSSLGSKKQIYNTFKQIGPARAFVNPNMILIRQDEEIAVQPEARKRTEATRADIFNYLCPVCRHQAYNTQGEL